MKRILSFSAENALVGFQFPRLIIWFFFDFVSKKTNEQKLLQQAKDFTNQLAQQKLELEKAAVSPDDKSVTEASQMREKLLNYHNDLAETEERLNQLNYKIQWWKWHFITRSVFCLLSWTNLLSLQAFT